MLVAAHPSDGVRFRPKGRSRLDEGAIRTLGLLLIAKKLTERVTDRDLELLEALIRTKNVTVASKGRSRSYSSRRTHEVLLPQGDAIAQIVQLYLDGDFDGFLLRQFPRLAQKAP